MSTPDGTETAAGSALVPARDGAVVVRPHAQAPAEYTDTDYVITRGTADLIVSGKAVSTRSAYAGHWRAYTAWCAAQGRVALPATEHTLLEYLRHLTGTPVATGSRRAGTRPRSPAGIEVALAAIRTIHRQAGHEDQPPLTEHVRDLMKGYRREWARQGGRVRQRPPLAGPDLVAVLRQCAGSDAASVRNRALVLAMVYGLLRASDACALGLGDIYDNGDAAMLLHLRYSKTDQAGEGDYIVIPHEGCRHGTCPVCCLRDWTALLTSRHLTAGALFRGVDVHGKIGGERGISGKVSARLAPQAVDRLLRKLAVRAGVKNAWLFGGHSGRAGGATSMAMAGIPLPLITAAGRWKPGSAQPLAYIRAAGLEKAPTEGIQSAWPGRDQVQAEPVQD